MTATLSTIWDLLDATAQKFPDKGLRFLENGLDKPAVDITYPQLLFEALVRSPKSICDVSLTVPRKMESSFGLPVRSFRENLLQPISTLIRTTSSGFGPSLLLGEYLQYSAHLRRTRELELRS